MRKLSNFPLRIRRQRRFASWLVASLSVSICTSVPVQAQIGQSISPSPGEVVVVGNQTFPIEKFRCKTCGQIHFLPTSDAPATTWSLPTDPASRFNSKLVTVPSERTSGNVLPDAQITTPPTPIAPIPKEPSPIANTAQPPRRAATVTETQTPDGPLQLAPEPIRAVQHVPSPATAPAVRQTMPAQASSPVAGPQAYPVPVTPVLQNPRILGEADSPIEAALSSSIGKRMLQLIEENAQLKARIGSQTEVLNAQMSAANQRASELQMRLMQKESEQQRREQSEKESRVKETASPERAENGGRNSEDADSGDRLIAREIAELRETIARASQQDREAIERLLDQLRPMLMRGGLPPGAGPGMGPGFGPEMQRFPNRLPGGGPMNRGPRSPDPQRRPQADRGPEDRPASEEQPSRDRRPAANREGDRGPRDRSPDNDDSRAASPEARRSAEANPANQRSAEQAERQQAHAERQRAEAERQRSVAVEQTNQELRRLLEEKRELEEVRTRDAQRFKLEAAEQRETQQAALKTLSEQYKAKFAELNEANAELKKQLELRSALAARTKVQLADALEKLKDEQARIEKLSKKAAGADDRKEIDKERDREPRESRKENRRDDGEPNPKTDL